MSRYDHFDSGPRAVMPFEAVPEQLRILRRKTRCTLRHWGASEITDEAELVVTELAANVIDHVGPATPATLVLEPRHDRLRVELHDTSRVVPVASGSNCDAECGRGLHLLSSMCLEWGAALTFTGKAVWCEISLKPARHCAEVLRAAALLDGYRKITGTVPSEEGDAGRPAPSTYAALEGSATEAIADLLHWFAAWGEDPEEVLGRVQSRYEAAVVA
ncbi:ATP-binding protein [Streptomyces sp. NPDC059786]|uniref:ATP-binding protein n=1 Tax=Streptomyces sp. NPDC059786 TaxID=3346946 RepID=UPI0036661B20